MARVKKEKKDASFYNDDGTPKQRSGFRGWVLMRSSVDLCLRIVQGNFTIKSGKFADYPQMLRWPEIDDYDGAMELISAVMDKDVQKLQFFSDEYPDYDLGISNFITKLLASRNAKFPGGTRVLKTAQLPRGMRLDMEIATDAHNVQHLRQVLRRGNAEIAVKVLARKRLQKVAP